MSEVEIESLFKKAKQKQITGERGANKKKTPLQKHAKKEGEISADINNHRFELKQKFPGLPIADLLTVATKKWEKVDSLANAQKINFSYGKTKKQKNSIIT